MKTPFFTTVLAILSKDLQAERRSRDVLSLMGLFALLSVMVFSFALELDRLAREETISGVLWVTLLFASVLGFNRSLALERDQGNFDALLLAPVARSAIFIGKLLGNFLFTLLVGAALLPLMSLLYTVNMLGGWVIATTIVGIFGLATIGTLLATMTAQTRAREALLPVAMLPVALPFLLTAVNATKGIISGMPAAEWRHWLELLGAITALYLALCLLLYGFVVEE